MTAAEQPLPQPVPDRIYLVPTASDGVLWCDDPDPDGHNDVAVEYVRVGVWRKPVNAKDPTP